MSKPLVSVIIPCFKQAHFLPVALESVFRQTWAHVEPVIVDDGSPDNTPAVAASYGDRVTYLRQPNRGLAAARNAGIAAARGEYLQFLDADDVILPTKLSTQLASHTRRDVPLVAYCDYAFGNARDIYQAPVPPVQRLPPRAGDKPLFHQVVLDWETRVSIPVHCFLLSASLFRGGARFDESLPNHEDWDCWMQLLDQDADFQFCPEVLAIYRHHPKSMSRNLHSMRDGFLRAIDKHLERRRGDPILEPMLRTKRAEMARRYEERIARHKAERNPVRRGRALAGRFYRAIRRRLVSLGTSDRRGP